jgi:hypothetical protein
MTLIPEFNPVLMLAAFLLLLFIGPLFFRLYCGLSPSSAFLAMLASAVAGTICFFSHAHTVPSGYLGQLDVIEIGPYLAPLADKLIVPAFAAGTCILLLAALGLRLWVRWVIGRMTSEERLPGRPGIRAWFCASNVIVGLLVVALAWYGFGASPVVSSVAIAALLAAYPLLRSESSAAMAADDLSAERQRIMAMLETGKLTSEQCAELLRALGESSRKAESRQMPAGGNQRLMLLGAALVGFGFFLPWFVINPSSDLDRITNHWQLNANFPFSGTRATPGPEQAPAMFPQSGDISISGGDIQRGLGWVTLALALTAALLPYVASTLDAATARTVRLLCLGSGGFIVLYLVTTSFGFVSIGLIIAIGGYVLEAAGALRERRADL